MSKSQTKTKKYRSHYSHDTCWITAAQYIGEIMSERRATSLKRDLPNNFWNLPEWKKWYKYQVFLAIQLLRKYEAEAIILTLKSPDFKFVYSLKFKKFIKAVENYQPPKLPDGMFLNQEHELKREEHTGEFHREPQKKDNMISKLRELDE